MTRMGRLDLAREGLKVGLLLRAGLIYRHARPKAQFGMDQQHGPPVTIKKGMAIGEQPQNRQKDQTCDLRVR